MNEIATSVATPRGGMRFKHIALLSVVTFAAGIGASWWLADSYGWLESGVAVETSAPPTVGAAPADAPIVAPLSPAAVDSAMAAGNAARAEGLLVAIAARRAIENGAPLGYLTDQLRLRFGASQPQAVITVLQASQTPVTLQALQSELTAIDNLLVTGSREETLWATIRREFSELFVLRKADSPSPAPTQRMLRTHALVESGNIGGAIAEISAMPGASEPAVQAWLSRARRYVETSKALDTLERSALAAPVAVAPIAAPSVTEPLSPTGMPPVAVPE
jgi:hypothetical protein